MIDKLISYGVITGLIEDSIVYRDIFVILLLWMC